MCHYLTRSQMDFLHFLCFAVFLLWPYQRNNQKHILFLCQMSAFLHSSHIPLPTKPENLIFMIKYDRARTVIALILMESDSESEKWKLYIVIVEVTCLK